MSAIRTSGVGMQFGRVTALRDFSLDIADGEFMTILGPSGSGKSTLLGIISGLQKPTAGRIYLDGVDVTNWPANRRNIGLVFQNYALFPTMNVFDNIAFPLTVRRVSKNEIKERVERILKLVRLERFADRSTDALSGGQQQRVALARSLVFNPDVLLLDEPLGALDRKLRQEVQVELRELQASLGITTVMVTHDQEEALSLSDRIAIVNDGRLEQVGTPEELHDRPGSEFVADFFSGANLISGVLRHANDRWWVESGAINLAVGPQNIAVDTEVTVSLRPEVIRMDMNADDSIPARIRQVIYLGTVNRHHVVLDDGIELVITEPANGMSRTAGETVRVNWNALDAWVLPQQRN